MKTTIGKYLYAIPFLLFGAFHFINGQQMAGMVPSWIPGGIFWIYLTGAGLIAASISIIIQKKASLATLLLAAMLLIFVLTIHLPAAIGGDQNAMTSLLKDTALAGAALFMSGHFKD
ncbi:hypothetical protein C900_03168 [Fulvivirga imtechensis AK7]|uniref:DoxX family protein n=1 Tax=Fulvivirga imtechensis AK7 TaxID=1237149 RepID=L8JS42_9BACT|nr:hypothetical protein [Fulvivirga imtechensis]ELR71038.1 hypothetical protein C900_03168 [Fulvivirga imtechensis AK7]